MCSLKEPKRAFGGKITIVSTIAYILMHCRQTGQCGQRAAASAANCRSGCTNAVQQPLPTDPRSVSGQRAAASTASAVQIVAGPAVPPPFEKHHRQTRQCGQQAATSTGTHLSHV